MSRTADPIVASNIAANNRVLSDALGTVGRYGLISLGIGGGARLLQEAMIANQRAQEEAVRKRQALNIVKIPVKQANDAAEPGYLKGLQPIGRPLYRDPTSPTPPDALLGHNAKDFASVPWAIPATAAAVTAGTVGAYALVNRLLNKRRKQDLEDDVAEARGDFESALAGDGVGALKTAALQRLSQVYAAAGTGEPTPTKKASWLGLPLGIYGTGVLAALAAGTHYGLQRSAESDPTRLRVELARRRAARRLSTSPVEVELEPVTDDASQTKKAGGSNWALQPLQADDTPEMRAAKMGLRLVVPTAIGAIGGGALGAGVGAATSPSEERGRGARRGALIGGSILGGAQLGGYLGALGGYTAGVPLLGVLTGTGLGAYGGYRLGKHLAGATPSKNVQDSQSEPTAGEAAVSSSSGDAITTEQLLRLLQSRLAAEAVPLKKTSGRSARHWRGEEERRKQVRKS